MPLAISQFSSSWLWWHVHIYSTSPGFYTDKHRCIRTCTHPHTHTHPHEHHVKLNKGQWQLGKIASINHLSDWSKFYLPAIHAVKSVHRVPLSHTHTHTHSYSWMNLSVILGPLHWQILSHKRINSGLHFQAGTKLQCSGVFPGRRNVFFPHLCLFSILVNRCEPQ